MKPCVIFNPVVGGEKASEFRSRLASLETELVLRPTTSPESTRELALAAVKEGFESIVAVGGDGTFNEVLNGVGQVEGAFDTVRLGLLPLGTANVFAKELGLPLNLTDALEVLRRDRIDLVDLALATFREGNKDVRRYFGQLAGAGLDVRAIELVDWEAKKRYGSLAYVASGWRAILEEQVALTVSNGSESCSGELVLIGNGRFYGGKFELFPGATLTDGLLHAAVFDRVRWFDLARRGWGLLTKTISRQEGVRLIRGERLHLSSERDARFQLEGDLVGQLPCSFQVFPRKLQMIVP